MSVDLKALPVYTSNVSGSPTRPKDGEYGIVDHPSAVEPPDDSAETKQRTEPVAEGTVIVERVEDSAVVAPPFNDHSRRSLVQADPVVAYARRSSIMQPSRQGSAYNSPTVPSQQHLPAFIENAMAAEYGTAQAGIAFPNQGYVVPARSRTASMGHAPAATNIVDCVDSRECRRTGWGAGRYCTYWEVHCGQTDDWGGCTGVRDAERFWDRGDV